MSNWQPLEANSELITKYVTSIGFDSSEFEFQDLLSYEEWAQHMIKKPVLGLLYCYDSSEKQKEHKLQEADAIVKDGQHVSSNLFYMKQLVKNACGTVGVFHMLGNLPASYSYLIKGDSMLANFYAKCHRKSDQECGEIFAHDDEIKDNHIVATQEGSSNVQDHLETSNHFMALVLRDDCIYELDGRKPYPVNHGPSSQETFLSDACKVIQKFIERDPGNLNAALQVLAPKQDE